MNEEEVRAMLVAEQLQALKEIDNDKYLKISRDFEDIMYPTTPNTGDNNNG